MATKKSETYFCHKCGARLTAENCRRVKDSRSGYSHLCLSCEEELFERLSETQGRAFGLFYTCAATDTVVAPIVLQDCMEAFNSEENGGWLVYVKALDEKKANVKRGRVLGFADGITDIRKVLGRELSQKNFAAYIASEMKKRPAQSAGTEEQRDRWGTEPLYEPQGIKGCTLLMTQEVYDDLDRVYDTRVSAFKGQDLTPQQLSVLVRVSKKEVIADFLTRKGFTKAAADMEKSISAMLADENMRPKDKKPVEELRIDALVLALEEAGLMENGDLLAYDELIEVLRDKFIKSPKYEYSLDVADQLILSVINAGRQNGDLPPIQELPSDLAPDDEYGEFEPEETEREKENKRYLGITKVNIVDDKKGEEE